MSFLAQKELRDGISIGRFLIGELDENCFHQASYDLRLGSEIYVVGEDAPRLLSRQEPYATLRPGQFAILTTLEAVSVPPDHIGFISVRSRFKFAGLVNISGFHVDPTFTGKVLFAVQNVGPSDIRVKFEEPTFTIFFCTLTSDQIGKNREEQKDIHFEPNLKGIRLQDVQLLGGGSVTLTSLQKEVERLRTQITIYGGFAVAAVLALIINLLRK
jgi:dCTP deaminase